MQYESILGAHPDRNQMPGVEASTGSLGHGLPMAAGMAIALRIKKSDRRVFALVCDGECNQGSIWEAILLAGNQQLSNLTCIHTSAAFCGLLIDILAQLTQQGIVQAKLDAESQAPFLSRKPGTQGKVFYLRYSSRFQTCSTS